MFQAMAVDTGHRRLLAAMLFRAASDAQSADPEVAAEARRWLSSEGAAWVTWLDIPPERLSSFLNDLPILPYEQLRLFDW
jgi:hypothetical protein